MAPGINAKSELWIRRHPRDGTVSGQLHMRGRGRPTDPASEVDLSLNIAFTCWPKLVINRPLSKLLLSLGPLPE